MHVTRLSRAIIGVLIPLPFLFAQVAGITVRIHVVDDITGTPIQNARIAVRGAALADPIIARTGERGDQEFSVPRNGNYEMSVDKGEFFSSPIQRFVADDKEHISLEIRLIPKCEISGRVLFQDGTALSRVMVVPRLMGVAPRYLNIVVQTKEDGSFKVDDLPPGRYVLVFDPTIRALDPAVQSGRDTRVAAATTHPAPDAGQDELIDLRRNREASIGTVYLEKRAGVSIEGAIELSPSYPAGTPAIVHLISSPDSLAEFARIPTTNGGSFRLNNIPPGGYILWAEVIGSGAGKPSSFFGLQRVQVGANDLRGMNLRVPDPSPTIQGVVQLERSDEPRSAIPGVSVVHEPSSFPVRRIPPAYSRADGTFDTPVMSLASPADSLYNLRLERLPKNSYVASITQNGEPMQVPLTTRANSQPIHILLRDDGGMIVGRVEKSDSAATKIGPLVVLVPMDEPRPEYAYRFSSVNAQGEFQLTGIGPGRYNVVWFQDEDDYAAADSLSKGRVIASGIRVDPSSRMEMVVPRP